MLWFHLPIVDGSIPDERFEGEWDLACDELRSILPSGSDVLYPAPRVMVTECDPSVLGGPFTVMTRLPGQTLAHGVEGIGAGTSLVGQLQLLFNPPAILARTIDQWVDMQIRLHQLPAEPLLRAVTTAGIDAGAVTFEGQLARLRTIVERSALTGLEPGLAWLDDHRLRSRGRRRSAMATSTRSISLPTTASPPVSSTGPA
jgi:aminoglycoside phosphotransferase (APT) family kinase protein